MRKILILLMISMLLTGCSLSGQGIKEPVTFYYVLGEYSYGQESGVFAAEERETSGHREDLGYLIALYLIGPSNEAHRAPFPRETKILSLEQEEKNVKITLSDTAAAMNDADFSRGCACLTLTCLGLTDADSVTVISGARSVTMSRENLVLSDDMTQWEDAK